MIEIFCQKISLSSNIYLFYFIKQVYVFIGIMYVWFLSLVCFSMYFLCDDIFYKDKCYIIFQGAKYLFIHLEENQKLFIYLIIVLRIISVHFCIFQKS